MKFKNKKVLHMGSIRLGFGLKQTKVFRKNKFCNLVSICGQKRLEVL